MNMDCPVFQVVTASWEACQMVNPRDDGFRSGLSVLSTYTSESTAAGRFGAC